MVSGTKGLLFPVTIREFINYLCSLYNLSRSEATSTVYTLLEADALKETTFKLRFMDTEVEPTTSLSELNNFICQLTSTEKKDNANATSVSKQTIKHDVRVVTTLPPDAKISDTDGVEKLKDVFGTLINTTRDCLRISSPYLEQSGLNLILPEFTKAAQQGIHLKLLTRIDDVINPNMRLIMAILTLYELFGDKIEVRSFARILGTGTSQLSLGGVHAKLLIADARQAYVGSGEIRDHSLNRNFEVGLVIEDTHSVTRIIRLFESVWDVSREINAVYCREFVK